MKAHIGVGSKTKLIHAVVATAANVNDAAVSPDLLHGEETRVWGDQAYRGQTALIPEGAGFYQSALQTSRCGRSGRKGAQPHQIQDRAKVERCFGVIKRVFGFTKVRYRGLEENAHRLLVTCALTNLFLVRKRPARA